ncbi:esterase/lipase family protein [Shewanella sp. 0m-8]
MKSKLVFVHGFYGGKDTWGRFPELLKDSVDCDVSLYGFDSFYIPIFGNSTSVHQLAEGLLSELKANKCFDADDLILVGHSLGGLVIRQLLLNLEMKGIKHNVTKVAFFGVPHDGSGFASLLSDLPFLRCNKLRALNKDGNFIEQLNDQWSYTNLNAKLDIMSVVGGKDVIVTSNSAKSIFRDHEVETNIDAGHVNLVKPKDENDLSYKLLKAFIEKKNLLSKYKNKTSSTYKDWFKLDRHHDLGYVKDSKTENNLKALESGLNSEYPLIRLTGLSGLGKSRLIIEYLALTKNFSEDDILIYDGADDSKDILESINHAVSDGVTGLVIVETCSIGLHHQISKIIPNKSKIKVITLNFYHETVSNGIQIKLDRLEQGMVKQLLTQNLTNLKDDELNRLAKFIEGFPLLADMLIKQFRDNQHFNANFTEHDLVEKLINGDGLLSSEHYEILKVLALFDYVKCEKDYNEVENLEAKFINDIAGSNQQDFEKVITNFSQKELINRTGRLARVVPKPLALNLAMQWWNDSLYDRQSKLISELPDSMLESFCKQITSLDQSINVQDFVKHFCEGGSPFGQAELLLSKQGSRLFRALVEVNPQVTSDLLYRIIDNLSDVEIENINGDVRRNFVWSLEMLVFHSACFDKSAWCLFKLAQFENENYGNNATGVFSQLFSWQLPGTEANYVQRLAVLDKALSLETADLVIIEAVKAAIDTRGGSRTVGAEFQGTKPELKEWMPKLWKEVYSYWQSLFDILLVIIKRDQFVEQVKDAFGHELRGLLRYKQLEQLDLFIKEVIDLTDKYWPAAAQSVVHALHYDQKDMDEEQLTILGTWETLLSPDEDNLEEKLRLIVLNPSREYQEDADGHYIDVAAEDAKDLSIKLKNSHVEVISYLDLLMTFPVQKQSWVFGKYLVLESEDIEDLLTSILDYLREHERVNTQFISGFLAGLYMKEQAKWNEVVELIAADDDLVEFYPDCIRTGKLESAHLSTFIELIKANKLASYTASVLMYGSVTQHLTENEIAHFCMSLCAIDPVGAWVALDNINMYTHGREDLDFEILNPILAHLVLNTSFKKEDKTRHSDGYHWLTTVKRLLKTEDEEFALQLCLHLIDQVGNNDVGYSDLWDYLGAAFSKTFELHGNFLWLKIADKFIDDSAIKQFRLIELLGNGKSYKERDNSIFDILDKYIVVEWCRDEKALLIVGGAISMFAKNDNERIINPLIISLLSQFGDNKAFTSEIAANFNSRSWSGSLVPYLEADKDLILPLVENSNAKVSCWARDFIDYIESQIHREMTKDAEENMLRDY